MPNAESSQVGFAVVEESTWGTTPATPTLDYVRITGEGLNRNLESVTSEEIEPNRNVRDTILVGGDSSGDFSFEMSYESFDEYMASMIGSTDFGAIADVTAINFTFTATQITAGSGTPFAGYVDGQWIRVKDSASNDGVYQIVTADSDTQLTFAAATFSAEGPSSGIQISSSRIKNGTEDRSWTIEKQFNDISEFFQFVGCKFNTMNLALASRSILTGSFGVIGKSGGRTTSTIASGTNAANTNPVMNATSNVAQIREGGAVFTTNVQSLNLNMTNNGEALEAVANLDPIQVALRRFEVTGDFAAYFEDGALYDKFVNSTETSLTFILQDTNGDGYVFQMPRVKYTTAEIVAGSADETIIQNFTFQAILDSTTSATVLIDKI